jgi:hypothetical protein
LNVDDAAKIALELPEVSEGRRWGNGPVETESDCSMDPNLKSWCRERESNPNEVALSGF